ncbi:hypothetical protein F5Y00DRAFT_133994 [Daldinia vernicosa]|uniref:uncharacterized protein n=1 Tax=Daldinia vernicosa TaxID=114800 RepID=UPI002008E084|nr:uncharacterized protein F5Y00DRAFT_133994 [Daldinia vernicosa]KAI0853173.1 hypothetical protein F5Y00DRAFT_133994 [Daldinia vernicosa]
MTTFPSSSPSTAGLVPTQRRPRRTAEARVIVGSEVAEEDFNFVNARRRPSNSSSFSAHGEFKTKFEIIEPEPVFEERLHGPELEDEIALSKIETSSSAGSSSDEQK